MFPYTVRFVAALAIGGATGWWLASRRMALPRPAARTRPADDDVTTTDPRMRERAARQRVSDYLRDPDGRMESNALVDRAVEDTFPASDPPSFMQSVVVGPPPREDAAVVERRQRHKRADEDAFAE